MSWNHQQTVVMPDCGRAADGSTLMVPKPFAMPDCRDTHSRPLNDLHLQAGRSLDGKPGRSGSPAAQAPHGCDELLPPSRGRTSFTAHDGAFLQTPASSHHITSCEHMTKEKAVVETTTKPWTVCLPHCPHLMPAKASDEEEEEKAPRRYMR